MICVMTMVVMVLTTFAELTIGLFVSTWKDLFQNHKRKENFKIGPVAALGEHSWTAKREKNLWNLKGSNCLTCWNSRSAMTLKKCEEECLRNCSRTTYTNSNISEGNNGCLIWFRDPIDIREFHEDNKQNIYIRMPTSELGNCSLCIIIQYFFPDEA